MRSFSKYLTEQKPSYGDEFSAPGVTTARVKRMNQTTSLPSREAVTKAQRNALGTTQAKLALSPGRRSVLASQGAGLGTIQQEIKQGLKKYSDSFKPSVAAKGEYAKKLGAAANFVPKKLPADFKPDPGYVAPRNDPLSLGVSALPAVAAAPFLAPAAPAAASSLPAVGSGALRALHLVRGGKYAGKVAAASTALGGGTLAGNLYRSMEQGTKDIPKFLDPDPEARIGPEVVGRTALNMLGKFKWGSDPGVLAKSKEAREAGAKAGTQFATTVAVPPAALASTQFKDLPGGGNLPPNPMDKVLGGVRRAIAKKFGGEKIADQIRRGDPAAVDFGKRGLESFQKVRRNMKQFRDAKAAAEANPEIPGYDRRNEILARLKAEREGIAQSDTRTNPYFGYVKKTTTKPEKPEGGGLFGGLTGLFGGKKKGS
jgi:hypothetical protein